MWCCGGELAEVGMRSWQASHAPLSAKQDAAKFYHREPCVLGGWLDGARCGSCSYADVRSTHPSSYSQSRLSLKRMDSMLNERRSAGLHSRVARLKLSVVCAAKFMQVVAKHQIPQGLSERDVRAAHGMITEGAYTRREAGALFGVFGDTPCGNVSTGSILPTFATTLANVSDRMQRARVQRVQHHHKSGLRQVLLAVSSEGARQFVLTSSMS